MKHNLRVFAALLAALISCSTLLASCGETANNPDSGGTDSKTVSDSKAEEKDPLMDDLGEYDFKGYEYRVLSAKYDPNGTFVLFDVNEEVGDVLPDSLYKRNREIEERFNIKFVATEDEWWNNRVTLRNVVQADEDAYDMIMMINREAFPAALDNLLMPVSKLTHLDLDKDYYLKDINSALTINGKQILAYSQESVYTFERALVTAFNKKIADELQIPDLYETVKSGKWTNDLLFKYAEMATQDIDGNGELDKDDRGDLSDITDTFIRHSGSEQT